MKKEKLVLPISIVVSSIKFASGLVIVQINKQSSIERQNAAKIAHEKSIQEEEKAQKQKEYIIKRKKECYDLEVKESKRYNNVEESYYSVLRDVCTITYKNNKAPLDAPYMGYFDEDTLDWVEGKYFTKDF